MDQIAYKKNPDGTIEVTTTPSPVVNVVKVDDLVVNLKEVLRNAKNDVVIAKDRLAQAQDAVVKAKEQLDALASVGVPVAAEVTGLVDPIGEPIK